MTADENQAPDAPDADDAPAWEALLDHYPLRDPSEDPGWATKIVWTWVVIGLSFVAFILVLWVLGMIYE